ncbi:MAG TPA: DUF4296 domain-containing protein [Niastella sp.]
MNRLLLVCLSAFVWCLISCTDKDKIPAGVLPKDKMQKVLWDVIQAERFRETFIKDSSKDLKAETFKLYAQVFEIHKVTKDEFVKSYKFYMSRPDIARDMFDSLATQANRRREEMYKPKPLDTAQAKLDSAKLKLDSTKLKLDSAKLKTDSSKVKKKPVVPPPMDSSKIVLPQPAVLPPGFPKKRLKRLPLRNGKHDSLLKLKLKQ